MPQHAHVLLAADEQLLSGPPNSYQQTPAQGLDLRQAIELNLARAQTQQQSSNAAVELYHKLKKSGEHFKHVASARLNAVTRASRALFVSSNSVRCMWRVWCVRGIITA